MRRSALLLPAAALCALTAGCGGQMPYATSIGTLRPHERMVVRIVRGTVNAYAPAVGQPRDRYTVEAFASGSRVPNPPHIQILRRGVEIEAPALESLLVRVPRGVDLTIVSGGGDVNVTDISGTADVTAARGAVAMMLPSYGDARVLKGGDIDVKIGAQSWPGTLTFSTARGDVYVSVNENARFLARLATYDGTIFTDFNLRGTASGTAERIVGPVNGGAPNSVSATTGKGAIRLLKLAPQY